MSRLGSLRVRGGGTLYNGATGTTKRIDVILRDIYLDDLRKNPVPVLRAWAKELQVPELVQRLDAIGKVQREAPITEQS